MKSKKTIIILSTLALIIVILITLIAANISSGENINSRIATLPAVAFSLMYGQDFNLQNARANAPVLIISFSPDCEHCQRHAAELKKHETQLANTSIIMITRADSITTRNFSLQYELNTMNNVVFLQDNNDLFYKTFNLSNIPSMVVYNRHHNLVKTINGQVSVEYLLKLLNQ